MDFEVVPFSDTPPQTRELLWSMGRSEGSMGWYAVLAETTLAPDESAHLALLGLKSGQVKAALPLVRQASGRLRALTAPYTTRFVPAAESVQDAETLGRALGRAAQNIVELHALDPGDPVTAALLSGIEASGLVTMRYRHFANWRESIGDFESYWGGRPGELRETVRRKRQRLEKDGQLEFALLQKPEEVIDGTMIYEEIYAASWKPPEPHPAFMARMLAALGREGTVRLGFIMIGDVPAAVQIWLVRDGRATIFKLAHRPEFESHSPGTLLTHWMMSELSERGEIAEVDLGRGDDAYKRQWLSDASSRIGLIACNPASFRGLYRIASDVLPSRIAKFIRRTERV